MGAAIAIFVLLIVAGAVCAALTTRARMTLQMLWRSWLTNHLLTRWLGDGRHYSHVLANDTVTSIEGRITDDVRLAIEPVSDFVGGFMNSALSAVTFAIVLYLVGGDLTVGTLVIPGHIALAAIAYAIVVSGATYYVGRPLSAAIDRRNEAEAQFRFGLSRARANDDGTALNQADMDGLSRARGDFRGVVAATRDVIRNHQNLQFLLNANAFFAGTFAMLPALPKFLSGDLSLGALIQLSTAFTAVLAALNWFAENFISLSQWRASALRVARVDVAFRELDGAVSP